MHALPGLSFRADGDVGVLELSRAEKRNALDDAMVASLHAFFAAPPAGIRAVVLCGAGEHFSAGLDLSEISERGTFEGVTHSMLWHRAFEALEFGTVPVVAALHGAVIGGGLELAAACHVRVADPSAFYALPEGQRGIFIGGGGAVRLPRLIGTARVMDMILTGRVYDAQAGAAIGVSQYLSESGGARAMATELAHRIAANAPLSNFAVLHALPRIADAAPEVGYLTEALVSAIAQSDPEAKARVQDFLHKRAAKIPRVTLALRLAPVALEVTAQPDGVRVRNREPLEPYPDALVERLEHWALHAPDRTFLAERVAANGGWREVSYAGALQSVRALAQALLDRGLSVERPLMILSENANDHGLLGLAAQYAGIPHAPVSTAYSLVSTDFAKLRDVVAQVEPGLVYVSDGARYARALDAVIVPNVEIVTSGAPPPNRPATPFAELEAAIAGAAVDAARAAVGPDTIAKILFTSGSTGSPKGVINTQRMLCSNQQMIRQTFPFVADEPPVIVDWLPWNHTFGGNHSVGMVLYNGGTLYVNGGKPISPAAFEPTLANLREVAPTIHFDVPRGFEMLLAALRAEPALRQRFFSRLQMLFYAGAGIAPHVWDGLQTLAVEATGTGVFITTSLGSTETAPAALAASWQADGPGSIGIPMPGVEVKLVPAGEKLELRLRGPNVTPAYWRNDMLTRAAFDDEGYYAIGDAVRFADEDEPARGFIFDGRISEDFKLATGTWVSVGTLRLRALAAFAPLVTDAVVSGENRDQIALLLFPDVERLRALAGLDRDAAVATVLRSDAVRAQLRALLAAMAQTSTGSATRVERMILLEDPPSLDAGEITDKGSLNQRAVLARRSAILEEAHRPAPPDGVILLAPEKGAIS